MSLGPKNYAYKTNKGKIDLKVKGFRLNHEAIAHINFNSMCDQLFLWHFGFGARDIAVTNERKISRDKLTGCVFNRVEKKRYNVVYTKRSVCPDFTTLPFGF